ncbi:Serine/threonine-protein kinase PknB [Novipirellula aureliae]|uniref:Serine/threonine-protein kinase PknB n=1 Tax=Novipirellula aureliae TaxID=2527966 RepID=A0A5C6DXT3_9BACT|nr:serine/threonine-protein kinase [Novipirellula aureliae]TWU41442.1 Serine/threonine-protein kinase PknB [Novipirellula aureliae]
MESAGSKPKPAKTSFKDAAIRSGLVSSERWKQVVETVGSANDDEAIADLLVQSGQVTEYQVNQLRGGRTKFTLGPYLITGWIGQGGMGQVFKAVHSVMGRECAVKTLPLEKLTSESRTAFVREIRLQAGLDSPYVVRAYDAGQDGNVHYLVTEYVPGTDLRKLVRSNGPLTMNHAAGVISQAAMGLQYAHDLGLVHRDVKPGNILVTPDGHAKVSDIGLAGYHFGGIDDPRAGKIVGTADYLSPEQIRTPSLVNPLSDIYSLGCTLYYATTGKVPFPGGDVKSKCKRHCEQTPWHPRKFVPELSEDFVDVIADMMEKDPAKRIQSAAEVAERLEPWSAATMEFIDRPIDRRSWTPPPPPKEPPPSRDHGEDLDPTSAGYSEALSQSGAASDQDLPSAMQPEIGTGSDLVFPPTGSVSLDPNLKKNDSPSLLLPIALTLAIAVPISLLVGAIIGYLIRESM